MDEVDISSLNFPSDPTKLPTSRQLPIGDIIVMIKSFKAITSGEPSDADRAKGKVGGKLAIEMQVAVQEPTTFRGILGRKTFWIGTDECPMPVVTADTPPDRVARFKATWERNGTELMSALKNCGIGLSASTKPAEATQAAVGQLVGAHTYIKKGRPDVRNPGVNFPDRPEIGSFWKPGTREVRVLDDSGVEQGDAVASAPSTEGLSNND